MSRKTPRPTKRAYGRAAMHVNGLGSTLSWIAEEMLDPPVTLPYVSRQINGVIPFTDRLFAALVEGFGAEDAIVIRDMAAEARAERQASS